MSQHISILLSEKLKSILKFLTKNQSKKSLESTNTGNQKLNRYNNPVDPKTQKQYFVPCVTKNKDTLIYYTFGAQQTMKELLPELIDSSSLKLDLKLNSFRFNDILPDGKKVHELTEKDFSEMEKDISKLKTNHPDNNIKPRNIFFEISCPNCGNTYSFLHPKELPDKTFLCGLCERVLIDYTGIDDWNYQYQQ